MITPYSNLALECEVEYLTRSQSGRQWPHSRMWSIFLDSFWNWIIFQGSQLSTWESLGLGRYQGMHWVCSCCFAHSMEHSMIQLLNEYSWNNWRFPSSGNKHLLLSGSMFLIVLIRTVTGCFIHCRLQYYIKSPDEGWCDHNFTLMSWWQGYLAAAKVAGCVFWRSNQNLEWP